MPTFDIQIDATGLSYYTPYPPGIPPRPTGLQLPFQLPHLVYSHFMIPGVTAEWTNAAVVQKLSMPPGTYSFQVAADLTCDFTFEVTDAGTIAYDPAYASFLAGEGSASLVLKGFTVSLDARYLGGQGINLALSAAPGTAPYWTSSHTLQMLPGSNYRVQQGAGIACNFAFQLDSKGDFLYAPEFDYAAGGFLQGQGTKSLGFLGYPLLIDGRGGTRTSLSLQALTPPAAAQQSLLPPAAAQYPDVLFANLLPAAGFQVQLFTYALPGGLGFDLDRTGTVAIHPGAMLALDTFHGLQRLTVSPAFFTRALHVPLLY